MKDLADFFTRRPWLRGGRHIDHAPGSEGVSREEYESLRAGKRLPQARMTYLLGFMAGWKGAKA